MSYPGKLIKGIVWQLWLRGGSLPSLLGCNQYCLLRLIISYMYVMMLADNISEK